MKLDNYLKSDGVYLSCMGLFPIHKLEYLHKFLVSNKLEILRKHCHIFCRSEGRGEGIFSTHKMRCQRKTRFYISRFEKAIGFM